MEIQTILTDNFNVMKNHHYIYLIISIVLITACVQLIPCSADTIVMDLNENGVSKKTNTNTVSHPKQSASKKQDDNTIAVGKVGEVRVSQASIHYKRSSSSRVYSSVPQKTNLAVTMEKDGWYGVMMSNGSIGWIETKNVEILDYNIVASKQPTSRSGDGVREPGREILENDIIRQAVQYEGVRYVFGGVNPQTGMDCSAFVRRVFSKFGVNLPRTARSQATVGKTIPFDQLQPGDRLYFACNSNRIDHCGIYAGNGYFIHCSSSRGGVGFDTLASNFYWNGLQIAKR